MQMKVSIQELNIKKELDLNFDLDYSDYNLEKAGIRKIDKISFSGKLYFNVVDEIILEGNIFGKVILPDSVDLSDYSYEIDAKIEEIIENFENTLDINEILWENIVLEVPIRVSQKNLEDISGNGWKVVNETEDKIDPRLEKLQELFKGGE